MQFKITKYYNDLAHTYDDSRFSNSYGNYINKQENNVLKKYLDINNIDKNLDLACGTGRFLKYADYGLDISEEMVKISKKRYPDKNIIVGDATALPYDNLLFNNVISFHLLMHLDNNILKNILTQVHKVTKKEGYYIFDIPSEKRRKLTGYKSESWHGGNQISLKKLKEICDEQWQIVNFHGISFFPIHRIPKKLRKYFIGLDNFLCNSFMKEYASHLIFVLKKK